MSNRKALAVRLFPLAGVVALGLAHGIDGAAKAASADQARRTPPRTTLGILFPLFAGTSPNAIISEARALRVNTVRLSDDVSVPGVRPAFDVFRAARLRLVFTANHRQLRDAKGHRPGHPPVGPQQLARYRQKLGSVLDRLKPAFLQIENEEVEPRFYAGTMNQYVAELNAAVAVGHARGIPVTNGGITTRPLALLTWQDFRDRGLHARADDFARRAFSRASDRPILQDLLRRPFQGLRRQAPQAAWDKAKQLIPAFRRSRMDYVNFHWYVDDHRALREAVAYLRRATGKPVVTTEIGQHNMEPSVVTGHLRTTILQLRLPLVIWFDFDGMPALGLHSDPGALRPNGEAFRRWVATHRRLLTP